jgi:type I protein arginine methyltransferase
MYDFNPAGTIDYHHLLLADRGRTESYRQAIAQTVRPGDVVADLGAGTGILALTAIQAGARTVYAIEEGRVIELARQVVAKNGLSDRIILFRGASFNVTLPEQVDVLVTDTGDTFGIQGGMLGSIIDARERFLRKGGRIIPRALDLFVAPMEAVEEYRKIDIWKSDLYGADFSSIRPFAVNNWYRCSFAPQSLLSAPSLLARVSLCEAETTFVRGEALCVASRSGVLRGIGGWATTELVPGVTFSNSPIDPSVNWGRCFFPVETPLALKQGDRVRITMSSQDGAEWGWQVEVDPQPDPDGSPTQGRRRLDHSTLQGFPLSPEKLAKESLSYAPQLSRQGEAYAFLLSLFDGQRTLREIETELLEHYPDSFQSIQQARIFVRQAVRQCG